VVLGGHLQAFLYVYDGVSDDVEKSPIFDHHIQPVEQVPGCDKEYSEVFDHENSSPDKSTFTAQQ